MYICSGLRIDIRKFSFVNTASTNVSILCGASAACGPYYCYCYHYYYYYYNYYLCYYCYYYYYYY